MRTRSLIPTLLCAMLVAAAPAQAAEIEGVGFAERVRAGDSELRLHAVGLWRYRILFKVFVAALYLDSELAGEATPSAVLDDVPRRLEIEYFWSIPAGIFAQATVDGVARNTDAETYGRLRSRIRRINALYRDVEPGDRYALTYRPGFGTELALNGRSLGVIEGADFSKAMFAMWLGSDALDESLRAQLLARRGR